MNRRDCAHLRNSLHSIYVIWDDDECVYVGLAAEWNRRIAQHLKTLRDWTHIDVWEDVASTRDEAEVLEAQTIRALAPLANVQHNPTRDRFEPMREEDWTAPENVERLRRAAFAAVDGTTP